MRLLIALTGTAVVALAVSAAPNSAAGGAPSSSAPTEIHASPPAAHPPVDAQAMVVPRHRPAVIEHYVDINSASRKELMTLPGIGAKEANQIIANRPYLTKTELVTKSVLPVGPFLSLRDFVVARPLKTAPQGRK